MYLDTKRTEFATRLVDLIATARASITALWDEMKVGYSGGPGYHATAPFICA